MRPSLDFGRFRTVVFTLAATLRVSSLASCGSAVLISVNSSVDLEGVAPVERMLVFANIRSWGFSDAMYDGFEAGMTSELERCNVKSKIMNLDFRGLEDARKFRIWTELQPNAVLEISGTDSHLIFSTSESFYQASPGDRPARLSGTGWTSSSLNYEFELLDIKSEKVAWTAKMVVDIRGSDFDSGKSFAINVISRLQADGLLKGCRWKASPPPANSRSPYPGG